MNKKRVVIVGGGAGGAIAANNLPTNEFDVVVVDKNAYHYYWPWLLYIAFKGSKRPIKKEIRELLRPKVSFIQSSVTTIDLNERRVVLEGGKALSYDYLIVATGSYPNYQLIGGHEKVAEKYGDYHSTEGRAWAVWNTINSLRRGTLAIVVGGDPYRCPPSPLEGVFLSEEFFRRRGLQDIVDIIFAVPYPRPYPAEPMNEVVEPILKERGIDYRTFFTLDRIDDERKVAVSMEGEELKYDALIVIPPHVGADIKYRPEDVLTPDRFVQADKFTNNIKGFDDAFVIGDASAVPVAKTGVTAHLQATVVAQRLQGIDARNTGRTNCPFDLGYGLGAFVISDYNHPVVKLPPSRFSHLAKMAFAAAYWDMVKYPELWNPIFDAYFEATEPEKLGRIYV
ncbi:NAD(P)/FAD-dependent oxidoreductase [Thermoproteus tenax]|uniref:NAD(FAD)-dependent dehydrogenase n=1 Tax=Thermoproteus tenax (strain ATCC 35583 / DSM 2078 / JCM 9277 / NBRC 100435 / Kra 1) TaxID=768679 RepID=G4RP07_THETK|nr:FAD-dependent oxidoreductase [Thermoproteus tenax]CCC81301.1 NAD(FAD)-dependent dehydrogenase [Thermoproteus tenax Kra 1]